MAERKSRNMDACEPGFGQNKLRLGASVVHAREWGLREFVLRCFLIAAVDVRSRRSEVGREVRMIGVAWADGGDGHVGSFGERMFDSSIPRSLGVVNMVWGVFLGGSAKVRKCEGSKVQGVRRRECSNV